MTQPPGLYEQCGSVAKVGPPTITDHTAIVLGVCVDKRDGTCLAMREPVRHEPRSCIERGSIVCRNHAIHPFNDRCIERSDRW